jgi:hypothetical protein
LAGTSVETPALAGTMVEGLPPNVGSDATAFETPIATPQGTVVEATPMPVKASKTDVGGTAIESPAMKSAPPPKASTAVGSAPPKKSGLSLPVILGGAAVLGILVIGGIFMVARGRGNNTPTLEPTTAPTHTTVPTEAIVVPVATEELPPTEIPTDTAIPFTPTPETPYVVITEITLDGSSYIVDFEMHNQLESQHVHMFFNTVPPDQAGSPGAGPWKLVGGAYGPSPFNGYGPANRPPNATQMCALIANANHSVTPNSGNCVDLP